MTIETYRGEKHDICWDEVFNDDELKKKYDLSEEMKEQLKAATKGQLSSLMDKLKNVNSKKSTTSDPSNPAPKKRGRKSKAEKEELLRQQELEERQRMMEEAAASDENDEEELEEPESDNDEIDDILEEDYE